MTFWLLTEERPKKEVLVMIFELFAKDKGLILNTDYTIGNIDIIPLLDISRNFTFQYEVKGFVCKGISQVFIEIVTGNSVNATTGNKEKGSFVDYLVLHQNHRPTQQDIPLYAIEETKTDDTASRNTEVYQRATKFVFIDYFYPSLNTSKIMLYNLKKSSSKKTIPDTSIFGTNLLLTLDVKILGKNNPNNVLFKPFKTINDVINAKNIIKAKGNNTPIQITHHISTNIIEISGKLKKGNKNSFSDPNIGALTSIARVLIKLGHTGSIEFTQHQLLQAQLKANKLVVLCNKMNIALQGLILPKVSFPTQYWGYDKKSEKLVSIFLHLIVEQFTSGISIFENHAGSEKGYFETQNPNNKYVDVKKQTKLPDLVLLDQKNQEIIIIEAEHIKNINAGIKQLNGFTKFENDYINKYYPNYTIKRTVIAFGGNKTQKPSQPEVSLILNDDGKIILCNNVPNLISEAIQKLP